MGQCWGQKLGWGRGSKGAVQDEEGKGGEWSMQKVLATGSEEKGADLEAEIDESIFSACQFSPGSHERRAF